MNRPGLLDFSTIKRVLSVHHLLAMGDAVLLSVAFDVLKRNCPWLSLSVLTRQYASPFLSAIPSVDDIILLERFGSTSERASSGVALVYSRVLAILQLALFLRRGRYDCIFLRNDRRLPHTRMLYAAAKLSGARHLIILDPLLRKHVLASRPIVQTYLEILQELGLQVTGKERPRLVLSREGREFARAFFAQHGLSRARDRIVGLCPISNVKVKNWSPEHVAMLGNSLTADESIKLILFSSDQGHADQVVKSLARPPVIVGHLPFSQFLGLVARCDLFIGVDTGPSHVAAALGVPTIGIFGPTSGIIAAPSGEKSVALQAEKDCPYYRPLGLFHPGEPVPLCYGQDRCQIVERLATQTCTNLVSAAEVFAVARGLLQGGD